MNFNYEILVGKKTFWPGQIVYHKADSTVMLAYLVGHEATDLRAMRM